MSHRSLSKLFLATVLALPIVGFNIQSALAEAVSFTLINRTSRDLLQFYASPPSVSDWEEDILGQGTLPPGESVTITIDDGREDCLYDFKGVLGPAPDGSVGEGALIQSAVSVCDGGTYEYFE